MSTMTQPVVTATTWNRVAAVFRLHFVNPITVLIMPWGILLTIFALNLAVWALILAGLNETADRAEVIEGFQWSGASTFIFVYMTIVAVQAINGTFPFALGLSVTRRDYFLGTTLGFIALAAIFATGLAILAALEEATSGWGVGGRMFTAVYFGDGTWYERYFIFFALLLFFFFVGAAAATVYVRWKSVGLTISLVVPALLLIGLGALFTVTDSWPAVWEWFAANGWTGSYAWSLVITVAAGLAGFLILRRATPRS